MAKRIALEGSIAASWAVKMAEADVIAAYPITPQTHIVETLAKMVANGEIDCQYINVESEHSALSACAGAAAVGARTFTATCSQGLALMHEILFIVSALRLPVVMVVANRALSAPINIWGDHSDIMAERDAGWIQFFAENGQEVFDLTITAFKIAEDKRVLLPTIVNLDGFTLSHVTEPVEILEKEEVKKFLPDFRPQIRLDPARPITIGPIGMPEIFTEVKKQQDYILRESKKVILEVWKDFEKLSGRKYLPVEEYKARGAKILLLTLGSIGETAMSAVDKMRRKGKSVGLIKLRLWRPLPEEELKKAVAQAKILAVVDRAISPGGPGGPVFSEIRSLFYDEGKVPKISGFVLGLGGRDVTISDFEEIIKKVEIYEKTKFPKISEQIGVRQ